MRIPKCVELGLLFGLHLTRVEKATVRQAATALGESKASLEQVAAKLRRNGVLTSVKGPNGGFQLNPSATVNDVFKALDCDADIKVPQPVKGVEAVGAPQTHESQVITGFLGSLSVRLGEFYSAKIADLAKKE